MKTRRYKVQMTGADGCPETVTVAVLASTKLAEQLEARQLAEKLVPQGQFRGLALQDDNEDCGR